MLLPRRAHASHASGAGVANGTSNGFVAIAISPLACTAAFSAFLLYTNPFVDAVWIFIGGVYGGWVVQTLYHSCVAHTFGNGVAGLLWCVIVPAVVA